MELSGSIPTWIILLISICLILFLIIVSIIYLRHFQPEVWKILRKKLPILSRQNNYQVSPLYSCQPKHGIISRCFQNICCYKSFKCKWFKTTKQEPSRDTCFLCMKKVIMSHEKISKKYAAFNYYPSDS